MSVMSQRDFKSCIKDSGNGIPPPPFVTAGAMPLGLRQSSEQNALIFALIVLYTPQTAKLLLLFFKFKKIFSVFCHIDLPVCGIRKFFAEYTEQLGAPNGI